MTSKKLTDFPHPVIIDIYGVFRQCISSGMHFNKRPFGRETSAFICILTGSCKYTFNERTFVAEAGDLLFLPKGCKYAMDIIEEYSYIYVNFDFADDAIYYADVFEIRNTCSIQNLFLRLLKTYNSKTPEYFEECMSLMYSSYACIQREKSLPYLPAAKRERISLAADFLRKSYTRPNISIADAAQVAGMSVAHFRRLFRTIYSVCPSDYITYLRITNAKELLTVGSMSIGEIAEKTGFSSLYYFSRIFHKKTGTTPSEYRNKYSEVYIT